MRRALVLAGAVVLVLVVLAVFFQDERRRSGRLEHPASTGIPELPDAAAGEPVVDEPSETETTGAAERAPLAPSLRETAGPGADPSGTELRTVRLLVTDLAGKPLEAAHVVVGRGYGDEGPAQEHRTDREGSCTLELPRSRRQVWLEVERDGYAHASTLLDIEKELRIALPRAITLAGRVLDSRMDEPIAGAQITRQHVSCRANCEPDQVVTDEEGRYELRGVPSAGAFESPAFTLDAPGYPRQWSRFDTEIEEDLLRHDFLLDRGTTICGWVLDSTTRAPIEGAWAGTVGNAVKTAADGGFETRAPESDQERIELRSSADGYREVIASQAREELSGPVSLVLPRCAALAGTVRDPGGKPIAGARVLVNAMPTEERDLREGLVPAPELGLPKNHRLAVDQEPEHATSDESGRYHVTGLLPLDAHQQAYLSCRGYREQRVPLAAAPGPGETALLDFTLEPLGATGTIRGRLTLNGEPVRASVSWDGPSRRGHGWAEGERYELRDVEPGAVALRVRLDGSDRMRGLLDGDLELQVEPGAELEHDFTLELAMSSIAGRLRFEDGAPGGNLTVSFVSRMHRIDGRVQSAHDGSYEFEVPDGGADYMVAVWSSNELHRREGIQAGDRSVDFVLPDAGTLRLRVVDQETGTAVTEYVLSWRRPGEAAYRRTGLALADGGGWMEQPLPVGPVELLVRADPLGYRALELADRHVSRSAPLTETVALQRGVTLTVELDESSGPWPAQLALFLLEEESWEGVRARNGQHVSEYGELYDHLTIEHRRLGFDAGNEAVVRGLAPGLHRFKVFPDDVVIEPETIEIGGERQPEKPVVIGWRRRG